MNKSLLTTAILSLALSACGGGSGGGSSSSGSVTGVEMPSNMSVVSAQGSSTTGVQIDYNSVAGVLHESEGTDYSTDVAKVWVWDESLGPLQTVNEILCYMEQTAADEMVNTGGNGEYTALIDEEKCRQGQNTSSDTGQSSSQSTELNLWTVKSTRTSNSDPQVVHLWVPPSNEPGDDQRILVEVTAYEGVSASKPYGSFKMNFKGVDSGNNTTMTGSLFTVDGNTTGNPAENDGTTKFKLIMDGSESCGGDPNCAGTFTMKTHVKFNDGTGTSGMARTSNEFTPDSNPGTPFGDSYAMAFDSDYFLREGTNVDEMGTPTVAPPVCTDRNDFNTTVWRYNLYYSGNNLPTGKTAGQRVQVNSGFPITAEVNGETEYGYIGYWGLWLPDSVDTSTLTQVTRDSFGSDTNTVYDLVQAPGKLIKSTKSQVPLSELEGVTFDYWDDQSGEEFQVEYTTDTTLSTGVTVTENKFYKTLRYVFDQDGNRTTSSDLDNDSNDSDAPVDITPGNGQWLGMWSDGLGGNVNYIGGDTNVTFFQETFINTGTAVAGLFNVTNDPNQDGVVTFDCYTRCLKANISQTDLNNGDIYVTPESSSVGTPTQTYYFQRSDLTLYDGDPSGGGNPVGLADGVTPQSGSQHEWGMATDAFVVTATNSLTNVWDTWNESVSFRWETGSNTWNKTFAVREQGTSDFVEFDPPLQITYKFTSADDANAGTAFAGTGHYDKTFLLEYGGPGELWGIPWEQQGQRWAAAFTLADGTLLGSTDQYVVKAMEKEQKMRSVNTSNCSALTLPDDGSLPLPTSSDIGSVSITLSGKPTVTDAPAVIEGELQGS